MQTQAFPSFSLPPYSLRDRVILITGAGRGLGRLVALNAAKHGARLILLSKNVKNLESLYDAILKTDAPTPALMPMNLANSLPEHFQDIAASIQQQFGRLDGLLHNAAEAFALTPIKHYDVKAWHQILQTNINAPFMLTQAVLPLLEKSPSGRIVFTLADPIRKKSAYFGAHGASKSALEAFMQILAAELEANTQIKVNGFCPGEVDTDTLRRLYPGKSAPTQKPETLIPAYLALLSPDPSFGTGQSYQHVEVETCDA